MFQGKIIALGLGLECQFVGQKIILQGKKPLLGLQVQALGQNQSSRANKLGSRDKILPRYRNQGHLSSHLQTQNISRRLPFPVQVTFRTQITPQLSFLFNWSQRLINSFSHEFGFCARSAFSSNSPERMRHSAQIDTPLSSRACVLWRSFFLPFYRPTQPLCLPFILLRH